MLRWRWNRIQVYSSVNVASKSQNADAFDGNAELASYRDPVFR